MAFNINGWKKNKWGRFLVRFLCDAILLLLFFYITGVYTVATQQTLGFWNFVTTAYLGAVGAFIYDAINQLWITVLG